MAGIGFELRKLASRDDLLGVLRAYGHSSLASSGPWIFTILALGGISIWGAELASAEHLASFRLIIIYNFAFSLVLSAPVTLLATRFLADAIYNGDVHEAPGMLVGALALLYVGQLLVAGPFYLIVVDLPAMARLAALANFFLVTGVWVTAVFLTALKDYRSITRAFAIGMLIALGGCLALARSDSTTGLLIGFNAGLMIIVFSLTARIFAEYPYPLVRPLAFLRYFRKYGEIALAGLAYNAAIWVDKWIMWFAPEREQLPNRMISFPDYDGAMFLAYLSIVPAMAVFTIHVETRFFEHYLRFYRGILEHGTWVQIRQNQRSIIADLLTSARNLVVLQGSVSYLIILLAPQIFERLEINFLQLAMFRLAVLGSLFHVLFLFMSILLSYFDMRGTMLKVNALFLVANTLFTLVTLRLGFPYYGYGYFLASLVTALVTLTVLAHHVRRLPYQTFVVNNSSIR